MGALPLEGEEGSDERLTAIEPEKQQTESKTPNNIPIPDAEPIPEHNEGRGHCIHKESDYVKMLKGRSAVTGNRGGVLPKGMRPGTIIDKGLEAREEHAAAVSKVEVDYAMATVVESVEGLTPTYEEARKCPDWPKWEEAIKVELNSLEKMGTWHLVRRPPNTNIVNSKWVLRIKEN